MPNRSRFITIAAVMIVTVLAFGYAGGWLSPQRLSPARMAEVLQETNGSHPGFRRNHAKGVCVTGYFDSNGAGRQLSYLRPAVLPWSDVSPWRAVSPSRPMRIRPSAVSHCASVCPTGRNGAPG